MEGSQSCPIFAFIIAPTTVFGNVQRSIPRLSHGLLDLVNCAITERYVVFPGGGGNAGNGVRLRCRDYDATDIFGIVDPFAKSCFPINGRFPTGYFFGAMASGAHAIPFRKWLRFLLEPGGRDSRTRTP